MTVIVFSGEHLAQARLGSQSVRPVQDPLMALMPDTMEAVPEARELPEADPAR